MHEIVNLKEKLIRELEEYGSHSKMDAQSLQIMDTLAHTIKNLNKIIECEEENNYSEGPHFRGSYSMGRNQYSNGYNYTKDWRNADYYSMNDRYSMGNDDMVNKLNRLMHETRDERTRMEIQKFLEHM